MYKRQDDVILNTIGGLAGIFIFRLMRLMFKNEKSVRNVVTWLSTAVGSFVLVILVLLRVFKYKPYHRVRPHKQPCTGM